MRTTDARGREFDWNQPPGRIVSLVPSLTETLFYLGLGSRVVGVTDYCVHPARGVAEKIRRLGELLGQPEKSGTLADEIELRLVAAASIERRRLTRVEALIWKDPFMVVGPDTFAHDLLYAFAESDRQELLKLDCDAARDGRIHIVEGELLSWYGPRIPEALRVFSRLLT